MTPLFENGFTSKRGRRGGGGGLGLGVWYSRFQVTVMIEWGQKSKPGILGYAGTITNLQILKTPKNSYLNQAT